MKTCILFQIFQFLYSSFFPEILCFDLFFSVLHLQDHSYSSLFDESKAGMQESLPDRILPRQLVQAEKPPMQALRVHGRCLERTNHNWGCATQSVWIFAKSTWTTCLSILPLCFIIHTFEPAPCNWWGARMPSWQHLEAQHLEAQHLETNVGHPVPRRGTMKKKASSAEEMLCVRFFQDTRRERLPERPQSVRSCPLCHCSESQESQEASIKHSSSLNHTMQVFSNNWRWAKEWFLVKSTTNDPLLLYNIWQVMCRSDDMLPKHWMFANRFERTPVQIPKNSATCRKMKARKNWPKKYQELINRPRSLDGHSFNFSLEYIGVYMFLQHFSYIVILARGVWIL